MRFYRRLLAATVSLAGLVLLLLWMQGVIGGEKIRPGWLAEVGGPSEAVERVAVRRHGIEGFREVIGTLSSKRTVMLSSKIPARILKMDVRAGDRVEKGQILVVLDDQELTARLAQAEANLRAALAQRAKAVADFDRASRLFEEEVVSRQAYDDAEAAKISAEAGVTAAEQRVRESRAAREEAVLISPLTGVVVERSAEPGDMAIPGRAMITLEDPRQIRLEAAVPEGEARGMAVGQDYTVRIDSLQVERLGTIEEIVPAADPTSRTFLIRLSLPYERGLKSGMFGRVRLPKGREEVLLIPLSSVRRVGQLEMVRVLDDGNVRVRQILTGRQFGPDVEVLSGLKEGEVVVVGSED